MKNKIMNRLLLLMTLVLVFSGSCKKDAPGISYGSVTDQDGNTYKTVVIGTQTWMAENLKTTKYNDNKDIPYVTGNSAWINLTTPGYSWYDNDETVNKPNYGALYNWYTVLTGKLCPTGWHVPTDAEFNTLELFLGIPLAQIDLWGWRGTNEGANIKSETGWDAGGNGTNTSGFSALPGGYRYGANGSFMGIGVISYWWSITEDGLDVSWYRRLDGTNSAIYKATTSKKAGKYVRCVKD